MNIFVLTKNPCFWYLSAWCLYHLQGTLYESGSTTSQVLLLILLLISVIHTVRIMKMANSPLFFRGLNAMVLMYTLYGLLLFLTDGTTVRGMVMSIDSMSYLKEYYVALLPIYSCYYYSRKGYLTEKVLALFAVIFVGVGVLVYFRIQRELLEALYLKGSTRTETTNNAGYIMLSIIPTLLVLNKKPLLQYMGIGVCAVFVILAMKRGAILCTTLFLLFFVWHKMKNTRGNRRFFAVMAITVGFIMLAGFVETRMENSDYFMMRIEQTREGDSSERDILYQGFIKHFIEDANLFNQLFGYGAYGTIKISQNFAHNDWLEILTNQGVLGVIIFISFCLCFYRMSRNKYYHTESQFALLMIFIIFLLQTFFSAGITNTTIFTSCMTGYALADGFRYNE